MPRTAASNKSANTRRPFNLLKPYAPPATAWDKIYDWILTQARLVMVVAEIAVAIAFVGKVIVDVHAKNLEERIAAEDYKLAQYAVKVEPNLRRLQQKALAYTEVWNTSSAYTDVLVEVNQYVPEFTEDLNIRIAANQVTIRGGQNLNLLSEIEAKMRLSDTFTNVLVANLTTEGGDVNTNVANYTLTATITTLADREKLGTE